MIIRDLDRRNRIVSEVKLISVPPVPAMQDCEAYGFKPVSEISSWECWEFRSSATLSFFFRWIADQWVVIYSGERDAALAWLQQYYQTYEQDMLVWKGVDPRTDDIKEYCEWDELRRIQRDEAMTKEQLFDFKDALKHLDNKQKSIINGNYNGPVLVTGPAGTGKTLVAIARALSFAQGLPVRNGRILFVTYTNNLADEINALISKIDKEGNIVARRIHVYTIDKVSYEIVNILSPEDDELEAIVFNCAEKRNLHAKRLLLLSEWKDVISAQGITEMKEYFSASRGGTGSSGISEADKKLYWPVMKDVMSEIKKIGRIDYNHKALNAVERLQKGESKSAFFADRFTAVFADEIQDISAPRLMLIDALCHSSLLWLTGDTAQRIYFPGKVSLRSLGIETRSRSHKLSINYRNSREIMKVANNYLQNENESLEGEQEKSDEVVFTLTGSKPKFAVFQSRQDEIAWIANIVNSWLNGDDDISEHDIAIIAPEWSVHRLVEAQLFVLGISCCRYNKKTRGLPKRNKIHLHSIHGSSGLEYRAVLFICQDLIVNPKFFLSKKYVGTTRAKERAIHSRALIERNSN